MKKQTPVSIIYQMIADGKSSELNKMKASLMLQEKKLVTEAYMANFNPSIPYEDNEEENYFNKNYNQ